MNTAQRAADVIVRLAEHDAGEKLKQFYQHTRKLWSEAHSVPAGCGCTPFYADARQADRELEERKKKFVARFGQKALDALHI